MDVKKFKILLEIALLLLLVSFLLLSRVVSDRKLQLDLLYNHLIWQSYRESHFLP